MAIKRLCILVVLMLALVPVFVHANPAQSDVIAYYAFENDITDETGTWDGVSSSSIGYTTGKNGNGIVITPPGYANMGDITELDSVAEYTACAWIYYTAVANGAIFTKDSGSTNSIGFFALAGGADYEIMANGGNAYKNYAALPSNSNWHFLCQVYDGGQATSADRIIEYRDGSSYAHTGYTGTFGTTTANMGNLYVGRWQSQGLSLPATATVDELMIFDYALSSSEVSYLYNSGTGIFYDDLSGGGTPASPYFTVTVEDAEDHTPITGATFTFGNGTSYVNESGSFYQFGFNDSRLVNLTVSKLKYHNVSFTNYNTSVDLVANLSQYAWTYLYNVYNGTRINGYSAKIDGHDYYSDSDGFAYVPYNESQDVLFYIPAYFPLDMFTDSWLPDTAFTTNLEYVNGFVTWDEVTGSQYTGVKRDDIELNLTDVDYVTYTYLLPYTSANSGGYLDLFFYNDATCSGSGAYYRISGKAYNVTTTVTVSRAAFTETSVDWGSINCIMLRDRVTSTTGTFTGYKFGNLKVYDTGKDFYFNVSLVHDFSDLTDVNTSTYQAAVRFNASEIITLQGVPAANFTIGGVTKNVDEPFYLNAGTYSVLFQGPDYFDKTQNYDVTMLENDTQTFTGVSDSIVQINASEYFLGTPITTFNVTIWNNEFDYNESYAVTSGWVNVSVLQDTDFNYRFVSTGYVSVFDTISSDAQIYNYTIEFYADNQIKVSFYDEETLLPVTNGTIVLYSVNTLEFGSLYNASGLNYSTFLNSIPEGFYGIEYTAPGYTTRNYFVNVPLISVVDANLTLYVLNESSASTIVAKTTDTNNRPLQGVYVSLLRRYVENNQTTYRVVEMFRPSYALQGSAPFTAVPNTVPYLFRVQDDDGTVLYQGAATGSSNYETLYLIDSLLYLKVQTSGNAFDIYQDLNGFSYQLLNTTSRTFWVSWSDTEDAVSQLCLEVMANNSDVVHSACSQASSGILSYAAEESNSTYYVGRVKVKPTSDATQEFTVDLAVLNYEAAKRSTSQVFGFLGIFVLVLALIVSAIALAYEPVIGIIVAALSVIAFGPMILGWVYIGFTLQCTVFIVSLVAVYVIGVKR